MRLCAAVSRRLFLGPPSAGNQSADAIPLLHRLAIVYLMLPVVIWLVGWHEWWVGVPAAAAVVLALWRGLAGSWRVSVRPLHVALMLIAAAWVMATAAGGVFNVFNLDWPKHRGVFLDLARGDWPVSLPLWVSDMAVYFPGDVELTGSLLRYYLGYYMVPGFIGKWLGVASLNWAVPLWTWCGVALMLALFTRGFAGWRSLAAAAVFVFFSGMDIVTVGLFEGWQWLEFRLDLHGWPDLSLGRGFLEWDRYWEVKVQFLSHMVGLMWVPQHFMAGVLCVLLLVQLREHRRFLAVSGVVVGASVFWSPFVAIGLLPFVAALLYGNGVRPFLSWQNLVVGVPLAALLFAFLTIDTGDIPHFWLWEFAGRLNVVRGLPLLYVFEFLLLAALLVLKRPALLRQPFFIPALLTLLLLPLYYFGLHNDLVMRGLIPSLAVLSFYCADTIAGAPPRGASRAGKIRGRSLAALIVAVLAVGSFGPVINLANANSQRDFGTYRYDRFGLESSTAHLVSGPIINQYLAQDVPRWYRILLDDPPESSEPVKSELLIASEFNVFLLNERILVFEKTPCTEKDTQAKFIMHIFPNEKGPRVHHTLDFEFPQGAGITIGETCVTTRALPNVSYGRIRAGQYTLYQTGQSWMGNSYTREYRDRLIAEAGEPIVQSNFAVYVVRDTIMYTKAACSTEDTTAPFFLQTAPTDLENLPDDRREEGFEEFEIDFMENGGRIGESCIAVYELPGYALARITTGQRSPVAERAWEGTHTTGDGANED